METEPWSHQCIHTASWEVRGEGSSGMGVEGRAGT